MVRPAPGLRRVAGALALLLAGAACSDGSAVAAASALGSTVGSTTTVTAATTAPEPTAPTPAPPAPTTLPPTTTTVPPTTTTAPPPPRAVGHQPYAPYAVVGPVVLRHPAAAVERVAFHESNHDGARRQEALETTVAPVVLESRDRGNDPQSAADIVVDPTAELRAPVTGTVLRGGTYTLYCDHTDEFVVIEPDDRPGWEVKVLHFVGLQVGRGQRVVAGETVIGLHARVLPFESQVDELAGPLGPWPHVHVEVVDPSIPDRPGEPC